MDQSSILHKEGVLVDGRPGHPLQKGIAVHESIIHSLQNGLMVHKSLIHPLQNYLVGGCFSHPCTNNLCVSIIF